LPANHQGRARMPIPQNWIIFLWSSLSPLIACGEGVGCGVLVPGLMTICCKLRVRKKEEEKELFSHYLFPNLRSV